MLKTYNAIRKDLINKIYSNTNDAEINNYFDSINVDMVKLDELLHKINDTKTIQYYRVITAAGNFKTIKIFVKKVIRKMIKFLIEPIILDVNKNNDNLYSSNYELVHLVQIMNRRINEMECKIKELETNIENNK